MILLKLRNAPTGSASPSSPGGTPLPSTTFRSQLQRPRTSLRLTLGQFVPAGAAEDYDAIQVGGNNLLVGGSRLIAP